MTRPQAPSENPRLPAGRLVFLLFAGICLLAGLDAALVRLAATAPVPSTDLGAVHGLLMVYGFLGTAICLERAVAVSTGSDRPTKWAYLAPLATGAGGACALVLALNAGLREAMAALPIPRLLAARLAGFQSARMAPGLLITTGMVLLVCVYAHVWRRRQASYAVLVQMLGALIGLGGALAWWRGLEVAAIVPWWLMFLVVTIIGERLELARLNFLAGSTERRITAEACAVLLALPLTLFAPGAGYPVLGLALGAVAADAAWHDVARRTIRVPGVPRLAAASMLCGYGWALVPALMWVVAPPVFDGYGYDAAVHALTIGFVVSMVIAHAPVIIPAVAKRPVPYHPAMWIPFALLQASLAVRLLAGARGAAGAWRFGGALGVVGMLVFVLTTLTVTIRAARIATRAARAPSPSNEAGAAGGDHHPADAPSGTARAARDTAEAANGTTGTAPAPSSREDA